MRFARARRAARPSRLGCAYSDRLDSQRIAALARANLMSALGEIGCPTTLVPTRHPVVDIVRSPLLTVDLAEARGVDPDVIRRDDPRWQRARDSYA